MQLVRIYVRGVKPSLKLAGRRCVQLAAAGASDRFSLPGSQETQPATTAQLQLQPPQQKQRVKKTEMSPMKRPHLPLQVPVSMYGLRSCDIQEMIG